MNEIPFLSELRGEFQAAVRLRVHEAPAGVPAPCPRSHRRRRGSVLVLVAMSIAAVALVIAAVLRGPAGTGTQPAAAEIVRYVEHELSAEPGTIVVQRSTSSAEEPHEPISRNTSYLVSEAVSGSTVQNSLEYFSNESGVSATINGDEELYLKQTNTIYISNPYSSYIHPGPRAGTYVYRPERGSPTPVFSGSITLTRAQVRSLESGRTMLTPYQLPSRRFILRVYTLTGGPATEAEDIRSELKRHELRFDGRTRLDGRSVYRFVDFRKSLPVRTWLYVDPGTYAPVKELVQIETRAGVSQFTTMWSEYRVLLITAKNERLLSLQALHPNARIDRKRADFLRAQRRS